MKVLFAVNNEKVAESIIKRYQKDYKEIISNKNVYYFNAILKELQKDKSYDRIVIGEDLEPFSNEDYEAIDKFIFDKLDKISDEAYNTVGNDIPIILICTDRRKRTDQILVKLFGIGIYNALIGQERSIDEVCELINKPRSKKEAKRYYQIDSESVEYKPENESDVSEVEIQNILAHYKKLGKNEEKYISSFDSIVSQYNDEQLKLIITFFPKDVIKVLEKKSLKYRQLMGLNPINKQSKTKDNFKNNTVKQNIELIDNQVNKTKLNSPVIIPGAVNTKKVKKVIASEYKNPEIEETEEVVKIEKSVEEVKEQNTKETKKRRGRPPKNKEVQEETIKQPAKRGRGRPPKKVVEEDNKIEEEIFLPVEQENDDDNFELPGFEEISVPAIEENITSGEEENTLPEYEEDLELPYVEEDEIQEDDEYEDDYELPGFDEDEEEDDDYENIEESSSFEGPIKNVNFNHFNEVNTSNIIENSNKYTNSQMNVNIDNLLTGDKKIVSFVGTTKNGTSFLVNNLAQIFSEKGIKTAVLDLTQNRNDYYTYTNYNENLMGRAHRCMENLKNGIAEGVPAGTNLDIYTSLPNDIECLKDSQPILETLLNNYSLILLDCDFMTDFSYFNISQEIYLVQSLDVLTIQPLTAFLRELKAKNILDSNKLRVVINKYVKSQITNRMIIGGISSYNDPSMSYMTELFDKEKMKYLTIPFEIQNYSKYLQSLVDCKISLRGYSKAFIQSLEELSNMVFPLINNSKDRKQRKYNNYNSNFSKDTNNTLNKMKRRF